MMSTTDRKGMLKEEGKLAKMGKNQGPLVSGPLVVAGKQMREQKETVAKDFSPLSPCQMKPIIQSFPSPLMSWPPLIMLIII